MNDIYYYFDIASKDPNMPIRTTPIKQLLFISFEKAREPLNNVVEQTFPILGQLFQQLLQ